MFMSTFDCDIEFIPGKDNITADGLSRFCSPDNTIDEKTVERIYELVAEKVNGIPQIPHHAYEKLKLVHTDITGHRGVDTTIERLTRSGESWTHMRRDVMNYIRRCPWCQKISDRNLYITLHNRRVCTFSSRSNRLDRSFDTR